MGLHLNNENITGDPVGDDDLSENVEFLLACLLFCKMPRPYASPRGGVGGGGETRLSALPCIECL